MKLSKDIIEEIYEHAMKEYPDECCGMVTGDSNSQDVHLCKNIQNMLHAEDPVRFPRDARTAYVIEREEADKIISSATKQGKEIMAFYHSHTEHEAYFSEEDFAAQTVFGEPEFPYALHVVVSVRNGKVHDLKCFRWDRYKKIFTVMESCG